LYIKGKRCQLTLLSVTLSHALAATATTLDGAQNTIKVGSTAPFLVGEDIDTQLLLTGLNHAHVGEHALILEGAGEFSGDGSIRMQSGEGDQLEDESRDVSFPFVNANI